MSDDQHIRFRKCAHCGCPKMAPEEVLVGSGLSASADHGLLFKCPDCTRTAQIKDPGALVIGGLVAMFWAAVAYWVFRQGPYWYATHAGQFLDQFEIMEFLSAVFLSLLGLGIVAFSGWLIHVFFMGPLATRLRHPETHENRPSTKAERAELHRTKRKALIGFFVLPLGLWVVLLALLRGLNAMGVDLRSGGLKYVVILGFFALAGYLGKRVGANLPGAVAGMVFWLVLLVAGISLF